MKLPVADVPKLPAMTREAIECVRDLEEFSLQHPQVQIPTNHVLHGGMYARTISIPSGVMLTGVLIKIPTLLIFSGHATAYIGGESVELAGYHVLPGSAGRKQAFIAHANTDMTMVFPSQAKSIEEAEAEFTDEAHLLFSRISAKDTIIITGE